MPVFTNMALLNENRNFNSSENKTDINTILSYLIELDRELISKIA